MNVMLAILGVFMYSVGLVLMLTNMERPSNPRSHQWPSHLKFLGGLGMFIGGITLLFRNI